MLNTAFIGRLKRISVILFACLLLILVAALFAKKTASDPVISQPEKQIVTQPQPFIGPVLTPSAAKSKPEIKTKSAATAEPAPIKPVPVFATQADAKAYLKTLLPGNDFLIMEQVIYCESGWNNYRPDGSYKISNGNIGFGQINRVHEKRFTKLGIDIYNDKGNLDATAILFHEQGLGPWQPYSGHCFLPKLKALGIPPA